MNKLGYLPPEGSNYSRLENIQIPETKLRSGDTDAESRDFRAKGSVSQSQILKSGRSSVHSQVDSVTGKHKKSDLIVGRTSESNEDFLQKCRNYS